MKPLQQLFGLCVEDIFRQKQIATRSTKINQGLRLYSRQLALLRAEYPDQDLYNKKKEKYSADIVKKELFDALLTKIDLDKRSLAPITHFFRPA